MVFAIKLDELLGFVALGIRFNSLLAWGDRCSPATIPHASHFNAGNQIAKFCNFVREGIEPLHYRHKHYVNPNKTHGGNFIPQTSIFDAIL